MTEVILIGNCQKYFFVGSGWRAGVVAFKGKIYIRMPIVYLEPESLRIR